MNVSEYYEEELPTYKIIIVGKGQAGKTKLLTRYKFGTYTDASMLTIGVDSLVIKTETAKYSYYDTAGQDRYKSIVSSYFQGSDACLLVYDVSSNQSFEEMAYYYNIVKEKIPEALIYIVGCKSDLERQVSEDTVFKYYKGYRHEITSAKKNINVHEIFKSLEEELRLKKPKSAINQNRKTIITTKPKQKEKCCN